MIYVEEGQFMKWMRGGESGDIEDRRDEGGGGGFHPLHTRFKPRDKLALATELGITYILLTFT